MDVQVHSNGGQRRLLSALKTGVFGDGLLVRARSTTLVLLGFTAAVGLTMVALALNQGWTLIPGVPLPSLGDREQAIGEATVAAGAHTHHPGVATQSSSGGGAANPSGHRARNGAGDAPAPAGSKAPGPDATVVSHSTPAAPPADDGASIPAPSPMPEPPAAAPAPEPASSPVTTPASERAPEPEAPSHATLASNDASGHDHGQHFGRVPSGGHSDPPESSDDSEQPAVPPPASDDPEGTHAPPWSHGHSHK